MRKSHSDLSAAFINAIYVPLSSITGFSTSSSMDPGEYNISAETALASTRHHASVVCTSPRYQRLRKSEGGEPCGTAQYATSGGLSCVVFGGAGAQTHLSAIVRIGRRAAVDASFTRMKSDSPPLD